MKNKSKKKNQEVYYEDKNTIQCPNNDDGTNTENAKEEQSESQKSQSNECVLKSEREGNYVVLYYEGDSDVEI